MDGVEKRTVLSHLCDIDRQSHNVCERRSQTKPIIFLLAPALSYDAFDQNFWLVPMFEENSTSTWSHSPAIFTYLGSPSPSSSPRSAVAEIGLDRTQKKSQFQRLPDGRLARSAPSLCYFLRRILEFMSETSEVISFSPSHRTGQSLSPLSPIPALTIIKNSKPQTNLRAREGTLSIVYIPQSALPRISAQC